MAYSPYWEEDDDVLVADEIAEDIGTGTDAPAQLIVFNDDHNTFEWVIECFMKVLGYWPEQSEQLALIIHIKGKCSVKTGKKRDLLPLRAALAEKGLSATIEN